MEDNKENIQQQPSAGENKGIVTPEPPQRKDPRDLPAADVEGKTQGEPVDAGQSQEKEEQNDAAKQKNQQQPKGNQAPSADRGRQEKAPPAPGESEKDAPTTTSNRNSY